MWLLKAVKSHLEKSFINKINAELEKKAIEYSNKRYYNLIFLYH